MIPVYFKNTSIQLQENENKKYIFFKYKGFLLLISIIFIESILLIYCISFWKRIDLSRYVDEFSQEETCSMLIRTISMQEGFYLDCEYFKNTTHVETYFNIKSLNPTNIYNYIMN